MACAGCGRPKEITDTGPQHCVAFRAESYADGELKSIIGCSSADFERLPDLPAKTLGLRLEFSDGLSRIVSGRRWIYLIQDGAHWTVDDDDDANLILAKYPRVIVKGGGTVVESVMQEVNKRLMEPM